MQLPIFLSPGTQTSTLQCSQPFLSLSLALSITHLWALLSQILSCCFFCASSVPPVAADSFPTLKAHPRLALAAAGPAFISSSLSSSLLVPSLLCLQLPPGSPQHLGCLGHPKVQQKEFGAGANSVGLNKSAKHHPVCTSCPCLSSQGRIPGEHRCLKQGTFYRRFGI